MASSAHLLAAYARERGLVRRRRMLERKRTRPPPRARRPGRTACVTRSAPRVFTWNRWSTSASGMVSTAPRAVSPALLMSVSIAPAAATARSTASWSVTSRLRRISAGRSCRVSGLRAVATTQWPRAASSRTVARPMPFEAPVMSTRAMSVSSLSSDSRLTDRRYHTAVSPIPEPTRRDGTRVCSIADALELVGERWSLLVVREVGLGVRRFNDIQRNTGAPREMLTARLRRLEEAGLLTRNQYSEHTPRYHYELTEARRALIPILRDLPTLGEGVGTPRLGRGRE